MSTPPRLTAASSDRMAKVAEEADAAVDAGADPALAIAKAARDNGLPVGHVPIVVRAFNTGRAVRQLSETDPWAKAAAHPTTTAEAVVRALDSVVTPATKAASSAYTLPPDASAKFEKAASVKLAASYWTKEAVARLSTPPAEPKRRDDRLTLEADAAALFDRLRDELTVLGAEQYGGVKAAAEHACPGVAQDALGFLEHYDTFIGLKAAAAARRTPDPKIGTDHPAVELVRKIAAVRQGYVVPPDNRPVGYEKMARDETGTWFTRRPDMPVIDLAPPPASATGLVIAAPTEKAAGAEEEPPKSDVTPFGAMMNKAKERLNNNFYGDPKPGPGSERTDTPGFMSNLRHNFGYATISPITAAATNKLTAPVLDVRLPSVADEQDPKLDELNKKMDNIDLQTAIQSVMHDPRLMRADPKTVIDTYQTLANLAPNVMRNQSVAGDLIHRRLQTGPLSAFDLKQLLDMEAAWVKSRRPQRIEDDD